MNKNLVALVLTLSSCTQEVRCPNRLEKLRAGTHLYNASCYLNSKSLGENEFGKGMIKYVNNNYFNCCNEIEFHTSESLDEFGIYFKISKEEMIKLKKEYGIKE